MTAWIAVTYCLSKPQVSSITILCECVKIVAIVACLDCPALYTAPHTHTHILIRIPSICCISLHMHPL